MAHMICTCGNDMWDGDGHIVFDVISTDKIEKYLEKDKFNYTWGDLYDEYSPITEDVPYFWKCDNCKRIHMWINTPNYVSRAYAISNNPKKLPISDIKHLKEYLFINWNIDEIDDYKIKDTLVKYPNKPYKYFVSNDYKNIYIINIEKNIIEYQYDIEYEDYNEYSIDYKSEGNKLITIINKTTTGKTYKYEDGEQIDITKDNDPITQVDYMVERNGIMQTDITKTEVYDKNMNLLNGENKIMFYDYYGNLESINDLEIDNLKGIAGMMTKCILKDDTTVIGYADPYRIEESNYDSKIHDYINLWTWDNLNEETHELIGNDDEKYNITNNKVKIDDIKKIECILFSNPKWGGLLTNQFKFIDTNKTSNNNIKIPEFLKDEFLYKKYKIAYVEYEDDYSGKLYCYLVNDLPLNKNDRVLIERKDENTIGKVINIVEYTKNETPYPIENMKSIIKIIDDDFIVNEFKDYNYKDSKESEDMKKIYDSLNDYYAKREI